MVESRGVVLLIDEINDRWLELMKQAQLNVLGIHEIVTEKPNSVQKVLSRISEKETQKTLYSYEQAGITLEYELHAVEWLLPRERFDAEPELFRLGRDGSRVRELNCCVSNQNSIDIITENSYRLAKLLGQSSHNYCLWPDDSFDSLCCCDKCRELSVGADHNIILMNSIIKGLRAYDSQARLSYLAYADFLDPPTLAPDPSLFLEFAPMQRNHSVPMSDPNDIKNTEYRQLLASLLKIFDANSSRVLEYWLDNALNSGFKKPPKKLIFRDEVIKADVAYYSALGFNFLTSFGSYMGEDYYELFGNPQISEYGKLLAGE